MSPSVALLFYNRPAVRIEPWFGTSTQRVRSERGPSCRSVNEGRWELHSCRPDHKIQIGLAPILILSPRSG